MLNSWNIRFWEYEFFAQEWLWLLAVIPFVLFILYRLEKKKGGQVKYTMSSENQRAIGSSWILRLRELILLSYGFIAALLIFAMAKPFHWSMYEEHHKEYKDGIDIVLTLDVSGSMLAQDFKPNRLEASKRVAKEFVDGRKGDRIGLVAYAGEAYTACPPTLDYDILKKQIDNISGDLIGGGTAIGVGLGTAVTRLRSDTIASKVIILLTDGVDGGADITPMMAAELARAKGIRVYTIGVGGTGEASSIQQTAFGPVYTNMEVDINEEELKRIATKTNGKYFRATDEKSLKEIYKEIEKLEKRKMEDEHFKSEPPPNPTAFLNWAFALALMTWALQFYLFKQNG
jgi:Ca-activated chloride channel family protein